MPERYLLQVLRLLVRADVIVSTRGLQGGYRLAKPAQQITLLDVYEAVDGLPHFDGKTVRGLSASGQRALDAALAGVDGATRKRLGAFTLDMLKAAKR